MECITENVGLQGALVRKLDVAIVCATRPHRPGSRQVSLWPDVRNAVWARGHNLHGLCSPQGFLGVFDDLHFDDFTGDNTGCEHHAAVQASNAGAAVGHGRDF
jgi:hypothetical protein